MHYTGQASTSLFFEPQGDEIFDTIPTVNREALSEFVSYLAFILVIIIDLWV